MQDHGPLITRVQGDLMAVNSYLVHGTTGVTVIDGQLTVSDARKVRDAVNASGLPLAGIIVTHAHPDHYAGIAELMHGTDVPVVSTEPVKVAIERDDEVKNAVVGPMMGDEWPVNRVFPNQAIESGEALHLGGVQFGVVDLGPGESPADSLWRVDDRTVFVGDLAYHSAHSYLADGFASLWLDHLAQLERDLPADATLYVGHGEPAGSELLTAQRRYVEEFMAAVEEAADCEPAERQALVGARMRRLLPTATLAFLMDLSIEPYAAAHHRP